MFYGTPRMNGRGRGISGNRGRGRGAFTGRIGRGMRWAWL